MTVSPVPFENRDSKSGKFVPVGESRMQAFMRRVNKNGPMHPYDTSLGRCWLWGGGVFKKGTKHERARLAWGGCDCHASRVAYELFKEPLGSLFACHSCDNALCVNPDHIWAGTAKDNACDCALKGRNSKHYGDANGARIHKERIQRGSDHYLRRNPSLILRGEQKPFHKLTVDSVRIIRSSSESAKELAKRFGVSVGLVRSVRRGKKWRHVCA